MPQHKALLIGASDYDDPSIGPLPFVRDDLQQLRDVLIGRGFAQADILESRRGIITQNIVRGAVGRFLRDAGRGDTLLILLSGHGVHFEGKDYLVPEDATSDARPFTDSCIEIGWHKEVEQSPAERVVFLIDACREGMELDSKSIPGTRRWKPPEIIGALRRKVAYVHACAKPQVALFVRETDTLRAGFDVGTQPGESFSVFSRAVSDVIAGDPHALRLREFAQHVQQQVNDFHKAYGKPNSPQQIMVTCEADADGGDFALLPGIGRRTETHPWVRGADKHSVWLRTREGPAKETLQQICGMLAGRLAEAYETAARALGEDPWHDAELGRRAHERLAFLTGRLADKVRLSPTEAALAFLFPLVAQTFWTQEAAQRIGVLAPGTAGAGPDQARFHKFAQGFPRLKRRLLSLEQKKAADDPAEQAKAVKSAEYIQWWLFHRWLIQQPELYTAERLKALLGDVTSGGEHPQWVGDALSGERLMRLLKAHRTAPFTIRRTTTAPVPHGQDTYEEDCEPIAAATGDDHEVRTPLVTALVKATHAMTVDPVDLPEIVVEHIGVHDSVDPEALRATVRRSDWRVSGLGRSLNAVCTHPAVQVALREHATRVDLLLRDINRGDNPVLAPLGTLPPYADGSRVRLDGNTPDQLSDGIRFQLAEDRVQELLMGEELYGDSELAVRELYQNALDAVRYRDRRTEYLRRTGQPVKPWEGGRIEFTQGVRSDNRAYLQCVDNGIGMGITELSTVFSQGGTRFVDLPEYIEEQAAWAELPEPKLELHPNSRFGIGVLSYFMLADEIVVETCRLGRDGRPGRLLRVTIAGPGNFFRVQDLGPGDAAGTTVQLLLGTEHRSVSCVDALDKVLWVAPYRTSAKHGARHREWPPGELSFESLDLRNPYQFARKGRTLCVPSGDANVWWVEGGGVILADGLYAESDDSIRGAVVNLHGEHAPELTVDRTKLRSFDKDHVMARLTAVVPSLMRPELGLPDAVWLQGAQLWSVAFADCVAEHARHTNLPWQLTAEVSAPFGQIGFFPPDVDLLPLVTGHYTEAEQSRAASFFVTMPLPVLRWRLHALYGAGLGGPVSLPDVDTLCARPSDLVLLSAESPQHFSWSHELGHWLKGPLATNYFSLSGTSEPLANSGLLSLAALYPWRNPTLPVPTADVFQLSEEAERPPAEVVERLTDLGYDADPLLGCAAAQCSDLPLLRPLGDPESWLAPGATLSAAQVCVSAAQAACPTPRAAQRLGELGFTVPAEYPVWEQWTEEELSVVKSLWTSYAEQPSPEAGAHVCAAQLTAVTYSTGLAVRFVRELLGQLGFVLSAEASALPELTDDDRGLLTQSPRPQVDREVPLHHVAAASRRLNRPARALAERLRELGYAVAETPDNEHLPSREEITFLSANAEVPDPRRPVPLKRVVEVATHADISLAEAVSRLSTLGYGFTFEPAAVARFRKQDAGALTFVPYQSPEDFGPVTPAALHAIAHHIGQGDHTADVAVSLTELGFDVVQPSEEWMRERDLEDLLLYALQSPEARIGGSPLPDDPPISLVTLAVVAMQTSKSLREAALRATELGIRHEAETWFTPAPAEPGAPSAAATPPQSAAAPPRGG